MKTFPSRRLLILSWPNSLITVGRMLVFMLRSNAKSAEENGGPLHQVLEEKALLQSHLTSLRTGHDLSLSSIAHRIKKYHLPAIHFPDNLDDTKTALRSVQARIRQIRQQSKSVREQSLIDQVRDSAYRGKKSDAEILEMMKKKEALAERWRRIGGFLQGKCRTSQFTSRKVSAVDWSATSPAADDILDGNYHIPPDEYCTFDEDDVETPQHTLLQEFLSSCQRSPTQRSQPLILPEISMPDLVSRIRVWNERTTTSPSGLHLGHLKSLTARLPCPPDEESQVPLPPPVTPSDASIQKTLLEAQLSLINFGLRHGYAFQRWKKVADEIRKSEGRSLVRSFGRHSNQKKKETCSFEYFQMLPKGS
eukprot:scaffold14134_cov70-Cylindrotheca_fusiformis.AAC.1